MYDPHSPLLRHGAADRRPPAPETKARFAEARLSDAVIRCEIAPGATITEAEVMDRFGLTRAAARAGLARLGHDGWAQPRARSGWRVLPLTGVLISQVFDARRASEPLLARASLSSGARGELAQIADILASLTARAEPGAVASIEHYGGRVESVLLDAMNPFTARHLRELWQHTRRILRYMAGEGDGPRPGLRRDDVSSLIRALLAEDRDGIVAARSGLIDRQETFVLRRMLRSDAPVLPGGRDIGRLDPEHAAAHDIRHAARNRRMT